MDSIVWIRWTMSNGHWLGRYTKYYSMNSVYTQYRQYNIVYTI